MPVAEKLASASVGPDSHRRDHSADAAWRGCEPSYKPGSLGQRCVRTECRGYIGTLWGKELARQLPFNIFKIWASKVLPLRKCY